MSIFRIKSHNQRIINIGKNLQDHQAEPLIRDFIQRGTYNNKERKNILPFSINSPKSSGSCLDFVWGSVKSRLHPNYSSGSHILEQHLLSISRMVCIDSCWHNIFNMCNTEAFIAADVADQFVSSTKRPEAIQSDSSCPTLVKQIFGCDLC